jgi:hypothetical protein
MVTGDVAAFTVIIVPLCAAFAGSAANVTAFGSDAVHVAVPAVPLRTIAGTWNVCVVLSLTNAEYIGEKAIFSPVVLVQATLLPVESAPVDESLPDVVPLLLLLEHAPSIAAAPHAPTRTAPRTQVPIIRRRMITPPCDACDCAAARDAVTLCGARRSSKGLGRSTRALCACLIGETGAHHMQVPPPSATIAFAQKLSAPPSLPKVQHRLSVGSAAQSVFLLQRRTVCVPVQVATIFVGHDAGALHALTTVPFVQFGIVPPVSGIVLQQTSPAVVQSPGRLQLPVITPPESVLLPLPESVFPPLPASVLPPPLPASVLLPPLPASVPVPVPVPGSVVVELELHAAKAATVRREQPTSQGKRMQGS